jgi:hypothetical protein
VSHMDGVQKSPVAGDRDSRSKDEFNLTPAGWSICVAIVTGFVGASGYARRSGTIAALGLGSLASPIIDQKLLVKGVASLLQLGFIILFTTLILVILGSVVWQIARHLPEGFRNACVSRMRGKQGAVLIGALMTLGLIAISDIVVELLRDSSCLVLKSSSEVGWVFHQMLVEDSDLLASLVFSSALIILAAGLWWLWRTRTGWTLTRTVFMGWVACQIVGLLFTWSFLAGITDIADDYPVVAFSNMQALGVETGYIPLLTGSDDKQYAFLLINAQAKGCDLKRFILYLPKTEVKWMTITRTWHLSNVFKLDELNKATAAHCSN